MSDWQTFWDSWPLFADAVWSAVISGAVLGFMGVYVVLRRMIFLSAALSQVAGFGVTIAFWLQLAIGVPAVIARPSVAAALLTIAAVVFLTKPRPAGAVQGDAMLGLAFLTGAAGTLLVGTRIVQELQDVESLLFGTAVAVLPEDLAELAAVAVLAVALHVWWVRGFEAVAIDRTDAQIRGLPVRLLELMLLTTVAVLISVVTRILGALPAFAFSVLPALAALRLASNVRSAMVIAAAVGAAMGFGGYYVAFSLDTPVGASQTMVGVLLYLVAATLARR